MKKVALLLAVALILSGVQFASASNDDRLDWYCFQKDPFRKGMSFADESIITPLSVGWEIQHGQKPVGTVLITRSMAIVTGEKGLIGAYSIADGSPIWKRDFGVGLTTEGTIMEDVMIVCLPGGKIVGLDTGTGGSLWETAVIGDVISPPIPYLSNFYITTSEKKFATISCVSGFVYSQIDATEKLATPLTIQMQGDYSISLFGVSESNQLVKWEFFGSKVEPVNKLEGSYKLPLIANSETLLIPDMKGSIRCMDYMGQKQYWAVDMGGEIAAAPCTMESGIYVAAANKSGGIKAIQIGNGKSVWEVKAPGPITQPLISVGRNVIAFTDTGHLIALSNFDGTIVSDTNISEPAVTPMSYSTSSIFFGTKSGKIMCVRSSTGGYKFTLGTKIVVAAPGTDKTVDLKLEGNGPDQFYIQAYGFPCRCKINRTFLPDTTIKPGAASTMKLTIDPTAPSAVYEVQLEVRSMQSSSIILRQSLTIIISKPEEMLKPQLAVSLPGDNKVMLKIGYQNAKFGRSFAGIINFKPELIKFQSLAVDTSIAKLLDTKISTYSFDASIPGKLIVFYSSKDTIPESNPVFEALFSVVSSGADKFSFTSASRTTNGQPIPADMMEVPYEVKMIQTEHVVKLQIGNMKATVDGKEVVLKVAPYVNAGKTMVPLRFIGDALGAEVIWNATDKSIVYKNSLPTGAREIKMWLGKTKALVDGKEVEVKPAPESKAGNTCVGLSFVSANFGCKTEWDSKTKTVTIKFSK